MKEKTIDLSDMAIFELTEAVGRERGRLETRQQDTGFGVKFWLEKCLVVYKMGNVPYVQEIYQQYYGRPVPPEYLQGNEPK